MFMKAATAAVMAISLTFSAFAYAQGHSTDRGRGHNDRRGDHARQYDRGDQYRGRGNVEWRGQAWRRGDRLPPEFRNRQYIVNDWRGHHLRPPPPGYHWVQHGNDYVLVAIASGIIAQLLLNHQ
jgi:Ni/Co efflux regulator RcnB